MGLNKPTVEAVFEFSASGLGSAAIARGARVDDVNRVNLAFSAGLITEANGKRLLAGLPDRPLPSAIAALQVGGGTAHAAEGNSPGAARDPVAFAAAYFGAKRGDKDAAKRLDEMIAAASPQAAQALADDEKAKAIIANYRTATGESR